MERPEQLVPQGQTPPAQPGSAQRPLAKLEWQVRPGLPEPEPPVRLPPERQEPELLALVRSVPQRQEPPLALQPLV